MIERAAWIAAVIAVAAVGALPCLASAGCSSSCTPAYDTVLSADTAHLGLASMGAALPLCSLCGGPSEDPYFECQSTCSAALQEAGADAASVVTNGSSTCVVDTCMSAVAPAAAAGDCNTTCATLYPGKNVTDCQFLAMSSVVNCTIHEPEVCQ